MTPSPANRRVSSPTSSTRFAVHTPAAEPARREVVPPADQPAIAETCTVIYERDGRPSYGALFALADDGRCVLGHTREPDVMAAMAADDFLGSRVAVHADRSFRPG